MSLEFEPVEEVKDRTKWIWLGIIVAVGVVVAVLLARGYDPPAASMVRARHILVAFDKNNPEQRAQALDTIMDLREQLLAGESFAKLAKEFSDDPSSAARGGDLGWTKKGEFEEAFEEYCWSAPLNELSDVVQTNFGYHLIIVDERHLHEADAYEMELERRAVEELDAQ